jgi:alpha-galactosidase
MLISKIYEPLILNNMKKISVPAIYLLLIVLISCSQVGQKDQIDLNQSWKFKTGDSISWAAVDFNDHSWDSIKPFDWWENQGYTNYDGFAWYRIRVFIPASIKQNAPVNDSIEFLLGKIDDCDQVFLNGEIIGENGKTLLKKEFPSDAFTRAEGVWSLGRRYVLPADDPRIRWDQENVIAVRVYDQHGLGGMFSKPFMVSMVGLKDYVRFDVTSSGFIYSGDSVISKTITIQNTSGKNDFQGVLTIDVFSRGNENLVSKTEADMDLLKNTKSEFTFRVVSDLSKPVYASITFREKAHGQTVTEFLEIPYILTPKPPREPRINGAKVFGVRPRSPFLFKVAATGEAPLKYSAKDLPEGLKIDDGNGIIKGMLSKKGEYIVKLVVENTAGIAERDLKIIVGNKISLTPPLGWNSWNCWGLSVSDEKVRQSALEMKTSGLIDHGWSYINIDDGWEDKHDKDGKILTNAKFPNMYSLCNYVHSLGLKAGIYSSPGTKTCGGYEGSYTFEEKDAQAYADWGIDYLKYDWCSYGRIAPNPNTEQLKHPYQIMKRAIRSVNRDIHYSLCQYGMGNVWEWGAEVDGNSWRTTGDIEDTWESMSGIGFSQGKCSPYSAPGRWNDPDMLVVGWVGWGPALHYTRLTPDEQYTHITLWSLLCSPLLIGCDLSRMDPFTFNLLSNDEVLAVNQDPLGKQATQVKANNEYQIWVKEMEDGSSALGLFNLTDKPVVIPVNMRDIHLSGRFRLRDLWRQNDLGFVETHFEMSVMPHGARMIILKK